MKKFMPSILFCFILMCFFIQLNGQDTFSIIAVDPETGEVGAAGATCVDNIASVGGIKILNKIIPGKGGVNAQAWICINPHSNLDLAMEQMAEGKSPAEIIEHLKNNDACSAQNFNPAYRQYGIVDLDDNNEARVAAFTGESADDYKGHIEGITYAIQGNILIGPEVLEGMEEGFTSTNGSLADKLMAAMQGANIPGADKRCLDRGTSSTSAFLKVSQANDPINQPSLLLDILEMPFGEEPIDSLQILFDEWRLVNSLTDEEESFGFDVFPNPANNQLNIKLDPSISIKQITILSVRGEIINDVTSTFKKNKSLDISNLAKGPYFLRIENADHKIQTKEFIKG